MENFGHHLPGTESIEEPVLEKDEEELLLEKIVFGDEAGFEEGLLRLSKETSSDEESEEEQVEEVESTGLGDELDEKLFFVDEGESEPEVEPLESPDSDISSDENAWSDSDDEKLQVSLTSTDRLKKLRAYADEDFLDGVEYSQRLRSRFRKVYPIPKWAKRDQKSSENNSDEDEEDEEEDEDKITATNPLQKLLSSMSSYTSTKSSKILAPGRLDITRLVDANNSAISRSAIQSIVFHPAHPLLLTAGYDRTLRIYHVDGKHNTLVTSLHVRNSPFQSAQFHPDGKRVFAAGRRRYLYIWDIESGNVEKITRLYGHEQTQRSMENFYLSPCGRYLALIGNTGWVNILVTASGQWITGAKVEGVVADIAWHSKGDKLTIATKFGDIWEWDSTTRKLDNHWRDQSGVGITTIALGGNNDRWCAVGGANGMVNIYDRKNPVVSIKPEDGVPILKPQHVLEQLVTTVSTLEFSKDGQMLVVASRATRDALRVVHVPSFSVFKNWPTSGTPLGRVTSAAFSPGCQLLCTGNEAGKARLWRLNHY